LSGEKFPALKDQLDSISTLLDDLVSSLKTPPSADKERPTAKEQALKLNLMLHRLVIILERIADTQLLPPRLRRGARYVRRSPICMCGLMATSRGPQPRWDQSKRSAMKRWRALSLPTSDNT